MPGFGYIIIKSNIFGESASAFKGEEEPVSNPKLDQTSNGSKSIQIPENVAVTTFGAQAARHRSKSDVGVEEPGNVQEDKKYIVYLVEAVRVIVGARQKEEVAKTVGV